VEKTNFSFKFTGKLPFNDHFHNQNLMFMRRALAFACCLALSSPAFTQEVQWASAVIEFSSELTPIQYSAEQALGKPNVLPAAGESPSAWTPDRPNRIEFLKLGFEKPMQIRQILVAESYGPTAISHVYAYDRSGKEYLINTFAARSIPLKGRLFSIIMDETPYEVASVKVVFDGETVQEYYSVDAIGISASSKPMDVEVEIMENLRENLLAERLSDKVNSTYKEYKPLLAPNGKTLYFSRKNHPGNMGGESDDEDIWYSEMDANGEWQEAVNMGPPLNNKEPNYVSSITPDGNTIVMLLGNRYEKKGKMKAGVSITTKEGETWTEPFNLDIDNDYNYADKANYFLTNNRQVLLLSVERDDTQGGRDLYVSFFQADSTWSEPVNMGKVVNSAGEEGAPFLAADDETLYFSSNGLGGYGGFDIYVSKRLDDTWLSWSEPLNMGSDINSAKDDLFFNIPLTGNYAYYSKSVNDEDVDIFRVEMPLRVMPSDVIIVRGKLLNKVTNEPIEAKIIYEKLPEGTTAGITKSHAETGVYEIILPRGSHYGYRAEVEGYLPVNENVDLSEDSNVPDEITRNLYLVPVAPKATIALNNIFFDFDRYTLKPASYAELGRLVEFMSKNTKVRVAVSGHTDSVGDGKYNMKLSEKRAKAVASYLTTKGIDSKRVEVKWFGEMKHIATNETVEGRRKNRRVEFTIIEN
jgi:outer membrane protein OmpA-like peptidoglycan-associated protein